MECKDKKKILYLGYDPGRMGLKNVLHFPVIATKELLELEEKKAVFALFHQFSHLILTSRTAVFCLIKILQETSKLEFIKKMQILAIGNATSLALKEKGINVTQVAKTATSEGLVQLIETLPVKDPSFFYPHSALARPVITDFLRKKNFLHYSLSLYTTVANTTISPPSLEGIEEIFFTSPSTVDAFLQIYSQFPRDISLRTIGPITQRYLQKKCEKA